VNELQDKYILGSMVILCCICVWHAVIGSIIYSTLPKLGDSTTTTTTTPSSTAVTLLATTLAASNVTGAICPVTITPSTSPGPECMTADKIALGILSFVYVAFHVVFLVLILCVVSIINSLR